MQTARRDGDGRDAGTGHATGGRGSFVVTPRPVGLLGTEPIVERQLPGDGADFHTDTFGFMQREEGELGVRVIAVAAIAIGPGPFLIAGSYTWAASNQRALRVIWDFAVFLGIRGGEYHGL